jgi:DNA-directed RNA polymerase sigma subunit (sigma70/sigma32)
LLALDEALARLAQLNPRQARIVECRFFAGMDVEQTAEVVGRFFRHGKARLDRGPGLAQS